MRLRQLFTLPRRQLFTAVAVRRQGILLVAAVDRLAAREIANGARETYSFRFTEVLTLGPFP